MADVDPDYHSAVFGIGAGSLVLELEDAVVDVDGVVVAEVKEGIVAGAGKGEHGFLAVHFHFPRVFVFFVEGAAEGRAGGCGGND